MRRSVVLTLAAVGLFVFGVIAAKTSIVQGVIPVGPYEADINKDGRINSIDQLGLAKNYGLPVPTATPLPPTPTPGAAWRQYSRGASYPDYSFMVWCDYGDRLLGAAYSWTPISEVDPVTGAQRQGALISTPGYTSVYVTCFDEFPYYDPTAPYCFGVHAGSSWLTICN